MCHFEKHTTLLLRRSHKTIADTLMLATLVSNDDCLPAAAIPLQHMAPNYLIAKACGSQAASTIKTASQPMRFKKLNAMCTSTDWNDDVKLMQGQLGRLNDNNNG